MGGSKVVHPIFFIPGATDLQLRCRVWPTRVKKLACYDKRVAMDQLAVEKKRTWQYGRAINREYTKSHNKCVTNSERTRGRGGGMGRTFSEKLNPRSPDETVVIPGATEDLDIGTSPPTKNNKQHSGCYQHPQEQEDTRL